MDKDSSDHSSRLKQHLAPPAAQPVSTSKLSNRSVEGATMGGVNERPCQSVACALRTTRTLSSSVVMALAIRYVSAVPQRTICSLKVKPLRFTPMSYSSPARLSSLAATDPGLSLVPDGCFSLPSAPESSCGRIFYSVRSSLERLQLQFFTSSLLRSSRPSLPP